MAQSSPISDDPFYGLKDEKQILQRRLGRPVFEMTEIFILLTILFILSFMD